MVNLLNVNAMTKEKRNHFNFALEKSLISERVINQGCGMEAKAIIINLLQISLPMFLPFSTLFSNEP